MSDADAQPPGMAKQRVPTSCTKAFDRVYYCYSPVHQSRHYYREGVFDDCRSRLKTFRMCVMSRLRAQEESEEIYAAEETKTNARKAPPIWQLRPEYLDAIAEYDAQHARTSDVPEAEARNWWK